MKSAQKRLWQDPLESDWSGCLPGTATDCAPLWAYPHPPGIGGKSAILTTFDLAICAKEPRPPPLPFLGGAYETDGSISDLKK